MTDEANKTAVSIKGPDCSGVLGWAVSNEHDPKAGLRPRAAATIEHAS